MGWGALSWKLSVDSTTRGRAEGGRLTETPTIPTANHNHTQGPLHVEDDEEVALVWSSPMPDAPDRIHLSRRLSISTTPLTVMGSPLASSDDLRRLASSSLISEVGVEQHFAFLAEAVGREACRPTSRTTVVLRDVNYKVWIVCTGRRSDPNVLNFISLQFPRSASASRPRHSPPCTSPSRTRSKACSRAGGESAP